MGDSPPDITTASDTTNDQVPFASVLHDLDRGRLHARLTSELREVVAGVQATGKAGALTLRLDIKAQGDENITITSKVGSKIPSFESPASLFFVDGEHNLSRNPTRQGSIFEEGDLR